MTRDSAANSEMIERLSRHDGLRAVTRAELEWLAAHGELQRRARGEFLARAGEPAARFHLYILLTGRITTYIQQDRLRRKVRETRGGEFAGMFPFSRMTHSTADIIIDEPVEMLSIDSGLFPALIRECPGVTAACVHSMLDRARIVRDVQLQDEKIFSLGKLAAGLAHELNNPASAALRSVEALATCHRQIENATEAMANSGLTAAHLAVVRATRESCLADPASDDSPLARADREDMIADWLNARDVDSALAAPLADARVPIERLELLGVSIPAAGLGPAIAWIAATIGATALLMEIDQAVRRIHGLITVVKGFTQMDRPLVPEPMHIAQGVRDSVVMMGPKARDRAVTIGVDVPDDLPLVRASAVELNQVWASLLDNALDAAPRSSQVTISARAVESNVVVSVVDQGSGVPEAIRGQVFDPFFTTKPIGQGRGLGLNTARRIVTLVNGQIDFDSAAGRTEFRVSIPFVSATLNPLAGEIAAETR